jgi:hypothetical protein
VTNVSGDASAWDTAAPAGVFTAAQAGAGNRPAISATGLNGKPSILFTAANSDSLDNTTANIVAAGATRYVLGVGQLTSAAGGVFFRFKGGNPGLICYVFSPDANVYYYGDGIALEAHELESGAPDFTQPFLIEWELTVGALPVVRVNGAARTLTGSNVASDSGTAGFRIGSTAVAGQYWPGHIADVYVASGIPSAADRAKLRTFFSTENRMTPL